jgi:hypothetical protein
MFRSKHCIFLGYSTNQRGYRCLDPISRKVYVSSHVVFDESRFPTNEGVFTPATTGSVIPVSFPDFSNISSSSSVQLQQVPTAISTALLDTPCPLPSDISLSAPSLDLSLDIQVSSPNFSASCPQASSHHKASPTPSPPPETSLVPISTHPMLTRSKKGNLRTRSFPNFTSFYSTKHPLCALASVFLPLEPTCYFEAAKSSEWRAAMGDEFDALIASQTWSLCPRPSTHNII